MNSNNDPKKPENRPGLSQLAYRITDYTASRKRLLSQLQDILRSEDGKREGPLARLTTRDEDDTAIALLDAWAVVADVLTFYQERIANEGYLRTATERRSVLELARMIGYELEPGVAASTYFAFTVEDTPDSPKIVTIPKGAQVMSIPGEDELPQTFETSEEFIARVDLNNLEPRASRPQKITSDTRQLYIAGVNTQLKSGDFVLLINDIPGGSKHLLQLQHVEVNSDEDYTLVSWNGDENSKPAIEKPLQNPQCFAFRENASLYGHNVPGIVKVNLESGDIKNIEWEKIQDWLNPALQPSDSQDQINLDALYPKILENQWLVLIDDQNSDGLKIDKVRNISSESKVENILLVENAHLAQMSKVTQVTLNSAVNRSKFGIRSTTVLAQSEPLELVRKPLIVKDRQTNIFQDPIQGKTVFLNKFVPKLLSDQTLIVSGQRIRAQLNDAGGVFHWQGGGTILWERNNEGLTNTQIRALIRSSSETYLLAGATEGLYRSENNGKHWEPIIGWNSFSDTLETKAIQVLQTKRNSVFVGTANGLFRSNDEGASWQEMKTGLASTDIRVLHHHDQGNQILIGTLNGGIFCSDDNGYSWKATGLNNTDVQSITSYPKVNPPTFTFAGTVREGIFRSADRALLTWQQITDIRAGNGSITTDGAVVIGHNTDFNASLKQVKQGDIITAGGQSRTVLAINPDDGKLTVDRPFRPDLTTSTSFTVNTGLTNRNITALDTKASFIFAGSAGSGVFRSDTENGTRNLGDRWIAVNTGLTDLEIRCLVIAGNADIWIGTSKDGVFRSTNNGESWEAINSHLTNLDVRVILPAKGNSPNFVAGIGILQPPEGSYPKPIQRGDVLQILESPASIPGNPNYQQWQLLDKDGFQGAFITTTALNSPGFQQELTLLPALEDDEVVSEIAIIQNPPTDQQRPILTLQKSLKYAYDPATVNIYANVVSATHGETVEEVLGSGDGHMVNQHFTLKKPPLTYVPAANAKGSKSSLGVRVNGVLWQEVPSLYPLKPADQNYIIRIQDDGTTTVTFGDGTKGTRLPTGLENITATYRSGIGLDGNLKAEQLSLLKTRPLGISEVTNPLPATGGALQESLTDARVNAPATVRTLDRIVSIRDFEDFAQGFSGIGKAQAVPLWNGETQLVHITIAAVEGHDVLKDSNLYTKLVEAIDKARDPIQRVQVDSYEQLLFNLEARLMLDLRYEKKVVIENIHQTLKNTFAFKRRSFGQDITTAEVIATIQAVKGVIAVDLDALYQVGRSKAQVRSLSALSARYDAQTGTIRPGQLLQLNPEGIQLTIVPTL